MEKLITIEKTYMYKIVVCLFIIVVFNSCHLIPCGFENGLSEIKSKKDISFFIGEYTLEKSINNKFNNKEAKFILNKQGVVEIIKISSKTFEPYKREEVLISTTNKWRFVYLEKRNEHRLSLWLNFNTKKDSIKLITSGKFYVKKGKPVVVFEIGDPDQCTAVRFIKK